MHAMDAPLSMRCSTGNAQPCQRTISAEPFHNRQVMPSSQSFLDCFSDFPQTSCREVKPIVPWQTNAYQPLRSGFIASGSAFVAVPRTRQRFPLSYVGLLATAILASPGRQLTLSQIYQTIEARFPEFTASRVGWKNTVRHNLSLHDCFFKGEQASHGRSCYWRVHPAYIGRFNRGDFRKLSREAVDCYEKQSSLHYENVNPAPHGFSTGISPPFTRCRASEGKRCECCPMSPHHFNALDPTRPFDNCHGYGHFPYGVMMPHEEDA